MSHRAVSALNEMQAIDFVEIPKQKPYWLKGAYALSVIGSLGAIVGGVRAKMQEDRIALGTNVCLGLACVTNLVFLQRCSYLNEIDGYSRYLSHLNEDLKKKTVEAGLLNERLSQTAQKLSILENQYDESLKKERDGQTLLLSQLEAVEKRERATVESLNNSQAKVQAELDQKTERWESELNTLRAQVTSDQRELSMLKLLIETQKKEKKELDVMLSHFQQEIKRREEMGAQYAQENALLKHELDEHPFMDPSEVRKRTEGLKGAVEHGTQSVDRLNLVTQKLFLQLEKMSKQGSES